MYERNRHQIESLFARPSKRFFGASRPHPDRRVGPLHRFWQNADVVVVEKLAVEGDRFVGPRLAQDFGALSHALGSLLPASAEPHVLDGLATLADAKVQAAIGDDVD